MAEYRAPLEDIRFLMTDVFNLEQLWQSLERLDDSDMETANAILEEAAKLCENELAPLNREGDEQGCTWDDGEVTSPSGFKEAYETFCEGGWGGLGGHPDFGGMGMPKTLVAAIEEMVQGACISFGLAPMLTAGACLAIQAHASDDLKQNYLPKMYSGEWSGAMDLTEPHCGTDLGLIRTKAVPNDDGSYAITGTKIFITWGEHDMAENIVHLVLAKLPDAPAGSKGISLFLVPKFLANENGELDERNQVACGSLEKKMGIKGSATCVMNYDGATGWLVGEPHKGLACMFTMMNYERLVVGIQGAGVADASYQSAVEYAKERRQGRSATGVKSPDSEADSLLVHGDVRKMLMTMRAFNEGSRAFYTFVAQFLDIDKYSDDAKKVKDAQSRIALYTPIAKAFITDVAFETTVAGQQVFGGHGFIREWGQEQFVRDVRITQIYEGTNGIQAMDLVGRKTVMCDGALFKVFKEDLEQDIAHIDNDRVADYIGELDRMVSDLEEVTNFIVAESKSLPDLPGVVATDYLAMFGYTLYAYMWVKMAAAATNTDSDFNRAKLATADFYFKKLAPRAAAFKQNIFNGQESVMGMEESWF